MSTLKLDTIASRDGTESTDVTNVINGSAKAWVNFDGSGTVAINQSFNVSSITDNANGKFTVNFTNAMEDTNYAVVLGPTSINATTYVRDLVVANDQTTVSSFKLMNQHNQNYNWYDNDGISAVVFR